MNVVNNTMTAPPKVLGLTRKWLIAIVATAMVLILLLISLSWYNTVRNGLIGRETTLNAQYQANQAELDGFIKKITEEFSVAQAKAGKLDLVLTDAVKGRYDQDLASAQPKSTGLFNAIFEAYPNLAGLDIYDRVVTEISAGRESFKQVQTKLLDQLREYESYRSKGVIHSMWASMVGYPKLEARIGTEMFKGKAALNQMHLIVTSSETSKSFKSGEQAPIKLGK